MQILLAAALISNSCPVSHPNPSAHGNTSSHAPQHSIVHPVLVRLPIGYIQLCKSVGTGVGTGPRQWNRKTVQKVNKLQLTLTINSTTGPGCVLSNSGPATLRLYWLWLCLCVAVCLPCMIHDSCPTGKATFSSDQRLGSFPLVGGADCFQPLAVQLMIAFELKTNKCFCFGTACRLGSTKEKPKKKVCVCVRKMSANEPIRRGNHLLLERIIIWSTHSPKNDVFSSVPARAVTLCYPHP